MLKSAQDVLASGDIGSIVDFAIEANRTITSATRDLGVVKTHLRVFAEGQKKDDPSITNIKFEGHLGVASVVLPNKPFVRARKGMRLTDLKKTLPAEVYESLFEEKVVVEIIDDYENNFAQLDPRQRLVVERYVEIIPATPRVNLPE